MSLLPQTELSNKKDKSSTHNLRLREKQGPNSLEAGDTAKIEWL